MRTKKNLLIDIQVKEECSLQVATQDLKIVPAIHRDGRNKIVDFERLKMFKSLESAVRAGLAVEAAAIGLELALHPVEDRKAGERVLRLGRWIRDTFDDGLHHGGQRRG